MGRTYSFCDSELPIIPLNKLPLDLNPDNTHKNLVLTIRITEGSVNLFENQKSKMQYYIFYLKDLTNTYFTQVHYQINPLTTGLTYEVFYYIIKTEIAIPEGHILRNIWSRPI